MNFNIKIFYGKFCYNRVRYIIQKFTATAARGLHAVHERQLLVIYLFFTGYAHLKVKIIKERRDKAKNIYFF